MDGFFWSLLGRAGLIRFVAVNPFGREPIPVWAREAEVFLSETGTPDDFRAIIEETRAPLPDADALQARTVMPSLAKSYLMQPLGSFALCITPLTSP